MCGNCDPEEICEECPEWIFTLADLIMCMMGLFVILWVLKTEGGGAQGADAGTGGKDQQIEVVAAIREAFGYVPDPMSDDPVDRLILQKLDALKSNGPGEKGVTLKRTDGAEGTDPEVTTVRLGRQSIVGGRVLFEQGVATLTEQGTDMLDQVAEKVRGHRNVTLIKGHASLDDLPEDATASQFMALSVARSEAAASYLISHGVSPDTLRVQGCGTYEPVAERAYTIDRMAANRRVEVVATTTLVSDLQDPARPISMGGSSEVDASPAESQEPSSQGGH